MTQMITSCQFQLPTLFQLFPLQEHWISLPILNGVRATHCEGKYCERSRTKYDWTVEKFTEMTDWQEHEYMYI
jgi:hypothetical protein